LYGVIHGASVYPNPQGDAKAPAEDSREEWG